MYLEKRNKMIVIVAVSVFVILAALGAVRLFDGEPGQLPPELSSFEKIKPNVEK